VPGRIGFNRGRERQDLRSREVVPEDTERDTAELRNLGVTGRRNVDGVQNLRREAMMASANMKQITLEGFAERRPLRQGQRAGLRGKSLEASGHLFNIPGISGVYSARGMNADPDGFASCSIPLWSFDTWRALKVALLVAIA